MKLPDNTPLLIACVLSLLPLLAWPVLLSRTAGSPFVWLYPLAAVAYAGLALACARERVALSWVLVAMSLLTSLALWIL